MLWPQRDRFSRLDAIERRVDQHDVDIKRLWKSIGSAKASHNILDGIVPEPEDTPANRKILIVSDGISTTSYHTLYNGMFGGSGNVITAGYTTLNPNPPSTADLSVYDLILLFHLDVVVGTTIPIPPNINTTSLTNWLLETKHRRLVIHANWVDAPLHTEYLADNIELNALLASLPITTMQADNIEVEGFTSHSIADATSHYLSAGLGSYNPAFTSGLAFSQGTKVSGGDALVWDFTRNLSGDDPGNLCRIAKTPRGSEVILMGSSLLSQWSTTSGFAAWHKRLYPSSSYVGTMPVQ